MKYIQEIYSELRAEETVFFQMRNRTWLQFMVNEMEKIFDKDRFGDKMTFARELSSRSTYFILGKWRDGMFELGLYVNGVRNYEKQIHILADTKESPAKNILHTEMINELIEVMDKYRGCLVKKRLKFDKNFNIVKG